MSRRHRTSLRLLPPPVLRELEAHGLEWEIVRRRKHWALMIGGRQVTLINSGARYEGDKPYALTIAAIRRFARERECRA